jgi:hypothetical protein
LRPSFQLEQNPLAVAGEHAAKSRHLSAWVLRDAVLSVTVLEVWKANYSV